MAFQSVPETAEIVITYTENSETVVNVIGAKLAGGYALADLESLADAVDASIVADWLPEQVNTATYVSTVVRGLEDLNDFEATNSDGAGVGGLAEVGVTGNVTFAVKKLSGQTGRSARGRLYWIGMPRSALQANLNLLDPIPIADIVAAVEAMRLAIVTEGWQPVIISRFSNGLKRAQGEVFAWLTTSNTDNAVDSQRRRLSQ